MLMRKTVCSLLILLLPALHLFAQTRTLNGKVITGENNPVSGATVSIKGLKKKPIAVAAADNGSFSIPIPGDGPVTLEVSAVGYDTKEVRLETIPGSGSFSIVLKESSRSLND